jgi:transposase-like protein
MSLDLASIYSLFPTAADCIDYLEFIRWNGEPLCPYCGSNRSTRIQKQSRHHCNNCQTTYSVTAKTLFHRTRIELQKWFLIIATMTDIKSSPNCRLLAKEIEVNKNTACFMIMRIKYAIIKDMALVLRIAEDIRKGVEDNG